MKRVTVTVTCDPAALTGALVAIELADGRGVFDAEQHNRLGPIVHAFRRARGAHLDRTPRPSSGAPIRIDNVLSWASRIDGNTLEQALQTSRLPFMAGHLALMPDAHLGIGATIGSVIPTSGAIVPSAVGVDIGCGMVAVETDLVADGLPDDMDRLHSYIAAVVPAGMGRSHPEVDDRVLAKMPAFPDTSDAWDQRVIARAAQQFGTLGGGNHFIEVCLDERDRVWVVLHSGSRGPGNILATAHIRRAKGLMRERMISLENPELAYLVEGEPDFEAYITDMLWAQAYAAANRDVMMDAVLLQLWGFVGTSADTSPHRVGREVQRINCHHNYTTRERHDGREVWLTRKGAIRAGSGDLGVIPGSMGTSTYIVRGLGNPASYQSCSHGAGRRMSRSAARKTLSVDSLAEAMAGKAWNDYEAEKLLDEHPDSYKDIDQVMSDQKDLVEVLHTLRQIVNFKGA